MTPVANPGAEGPEENTDEVADAPQRVKLEKNKSLCFAQARASGALKRKEWILKSISRAPAPPPPPPDRDLFGPHPFLRPIKRRELVSFLKGRQSCAVVKGPPGSLKTASIKWAAKEACFAIVNVNIDGAWSVERMGTEVARLIGEPNMAVEASGVHGRLVIIYNADLEVLPGDSLAELLKSTSSQKRNKFILEMNEVSPKFYRRRDSWRCAPVPLSVSARHARIAPPLGVRQRRLSCIPGCPRRSLRELTRHRRGQRRSPRSESGRDASGRKRPSGGARRLRRMSVRRCCGRIRGWRRRHRGSRRSHCANARFPPPLS